MELNKSDKTNEDFDMKKEKSTMFNKECLLTSGLMSLLVTAAGIGVYHSLFINKKINTLITKTDETNALLGRVQTALVSSKALSSVVTKDESYRSQNYNLDKSRANMKAAVLYNSADKVLNIKNSSGAPRTSESRDLSVVMKSE